MSEPLTNQETVALIAEKAKETGIDQFKVKISRKPMAGLPMQIATFEDATTEQIANPETWLPRMFGGGPHFIVTAFHVNDKTRPVGGFLNFHLPGEVRRVDPRILTSSDWAGPRQMSFPRFERPQDTDITLLSDGLDGAAPQAPASGRSVGGHFSQVTSTIPGTNPADAARLAAAEAKLNAAEGEIRRREKEVAEDRHRMELERVKAEANAQVAALREDVKRLAERALAPVTSQGPGTIEVLLDKVLPVALGMMQTVMKDGADQRLALAKMQMDANAKQADVQLQILQKLGEKPAVDPLLLDLIRERKGGGFEEAQMQMMSTMTQTTLQAVTTAAEVAMMGQGPAEPPSVAIAKQIVKGLQALALAAKSTGTTQPPARNQQLPGTTQPASRQLPPQSPPTNGSAQVQPATRPAQPGQPAAFGGIDVSGIDMSPGIVDRIEQAIRNRADVETVVNLILAATKHPEFVAELQKHNGGVMELFSARGLMDWLRADEANNAPYVQRLMQRLQERAAETGAFVSGDDELPEQEEEEGEGEGEGEDQTDA